MKRFYRSSQNRVLGGVAAGLANYFEIDVLLIRLLFIVLAITGGLGFLIYFFLWICSPYAKTTKDSVLNNTGNKPTTMESETIEATTIESETMEAKTIETNENASSQPINSSPKKCKNKNASGFLWGSLFLFLGLILLGNSFDLFHFQFHHIWKLWPLVFCFIGINMLPLRKALRWLCNILLLVLSIVLLIGVGFCPSFCHNLDKDSTWEHSFFHNKETYIKGDSDNNIHFQIQAERKENHTAQLNLEIGAGSLMGFIPLNGSNLAYATCRDSSNGSVSSKIFETQAQDHLFYEKHLSWSNQENYNTLVKLSPDPTWDIDITTGASKINLDLRPFKVNELNISAGASLIDLQMGNQQPLTKIEIESGVSSINLKVKPGTGLCFQGDNIMNNKNLPPMIKKGDKYYSKNYQTASNKIDIEFDGAISDFTLSYTK